MTREELLARIALALTMREPRCTCGHVLTGHTRRRLICYARRWCGCPTWTPRPRQEP